jgi:hypothetical protein
MKTRGHIIIEIASQSLAMTVVLSIAAYREVIRHCEERSNLTQSINYKATNE